MATQKNNQKKTLVNLEQKIKKDIERTGKKTKQELAELEGELKKDLKSVGSRTKGQISGFTDFIREQGVIGLAVGLAIGVASGATVKAIVDGFINPIIGFILGGSDLSTLAWHTGLERSGKELIIAWGSAANSLLTLIATAAVIYFLVQGLKLDKLDKKKTS